MNEESGQTVRKTYQYKLKPTPEQELAMAFVVRRCRELYNAALQERKEAWEKCGVGVTEAQQSAQLPEVKEARPEYRDIHSQVLQDVLTRLDRGFQAFFRRVKSSEKPGYPRFQGANRYNSFTYKQFGNGALLDNGFLVLSKIGRMAVRWSRPMEGMPKTVTIGKEADGWYVCISCADVPMQPLPATDQETGIDLGLEAFTTMSSWRAHLPPWLVSPGRARAQNRATAREPPQEGEQPQAQGGRIAGESPSDGTPPAAGLPPQDRARHRASKRHHVSRGPADGQHDQEPPPC